MEKRTWRIETKVIYEEDYKTFEAYQRACNRVTGDWVYVTSDTGWNGHGGYTMYQRIEDYE